jgi:hypothetical protein
MGRLVKGEIETKLHPDNINREEDFRLTKSWNFSTILLRHYTTHAS